MTQEEEVVLLDYWASPFGTMARIALVEKGVNFIHKFEDLSNKSPLLLEMNPVHHKIPVLVHKGKSICESNIIIQYIDEIWKNNSPLLPYEPYQRAKARFLVDFINKKVHGSSVKVWMGQIEEQENGKKELVECSKFLEEELGDKLYFGGDVFGFVDIALVPFYNWFIVFKTFANFNTIEIQCPKLVMWGERCLNRDSVSKSLPTSNQVYQAYLDFKKGW
ncbi:glutathione S-transferase U25-like [Solanum lycopersicum]|uniref:glutathione S-transferase U25-like n=1 Tax=Solanum lycopersicum TaxID=4081 RepID=UPI000276A19C|nr:glutathione S-transferase U25-like [Solanum lycopersicum]